MYGFKWYPFRVHDLQAQAGCQLQFQYTISVIHMERQENCESPGQVVTWPGFKPGAN